MYLVIFGGMCVSCCALQFNFFCDQSDSPEGLSEWGKCAKQL